MKVTDVASSTTWPPAAEPYLEVKHTPPEISVGNMNTWEKLWARMEETRSDGSPVPHSWARMVSALPNPKHDRLLPIVSAVFPTSRVRSDLFCAPKG